MTWLAQIGHVARKDVRQFWWLMLVYIALVAIATTNARAPIPPSSVIVAVDAFIVVAFGMATAATLVQSDSPSRSDAFWATRPLDPSAVLAAKLVVIVLGLIGVGVLGEVVGLEALGLRAGFVGSLVMRSIGLYAIWLMVAICIAALTPDFRTFALALLVTIFAFFVLTQMLFVDKNGVLHLSPLVPLVGVLVALAALVHRYQRRGRNKVVWGMAGLGVFTAFLFPLATADVTPSPEPPTDAASVTLGGGAALVAPDRLVMHLHAVGGDTLHSYTFLCDTLIAHLADGSAVSLAPRFGATYLRKGTLLGIGSVRWRPEPHDENIGAVLVELESEGRPTLHSDITSIDVAGRVNEYAPDFTGSLPLRTGESAVHAGTRLRIGKIVYPPDSLSIDLMRTSVAPQKFPMIGSFAQDPFAFGNQLPEFVLVNRARGEAMLLSNRSNSTSNGWVVLPGAPIEENMARLVPMRLLFVRDSLLPGREWYANVELHVFRWMPRGTYRVHARLPVP